jgi:hypothetical protein
MRDGIVAAGGRKNTRVEQRYGPVLETAPHFIAPMRPELARVGPK